MGETVQELTTDLDRHCGRRIIRITDASGEGRVTMELAWEYNRALYDEKPDFVPAAHPPMNQEMKELVLELLCALQSHRLSKDLTKPEKTP